LAEIAENGSLARVNATVGEKREHSSECVVDGGIGAKIADGTEDFRGEGLGCGAGFFVCCTQACDVMGAEIGVAGWAHVATATVGEHESAARRGLTRGRLRLGPLRLRRMGVGASGSVFLHQAWKSGGDGLALALGEDVTHFVLLEGMSRSETRRRGVPPLGVFRKC